MVSAGPSVLSRLQSPASALGVSRVEELRLAGQMAKEKGQDPEDVALCRSLPNSWSVSRQTLASVSLWLQNVKALKMLSHSWECRV